MVSTICNICHKECFSTHHLGKHIHDEHKISSKDYYDKFYKKEGEGICKNCGKETKFWNFVSGYSKYCVNKYCINKGTKLSDETKQKISKGVLGDKNGFYGKKHSDETKQKISKKNKGRKAWNSQKKNCFSEETKKVMSDKAKGRKPKITKERNEKISTSLKGRVFTAVHIQKIKDGLAKYYETHDGANKGRVFDKKFSENVSKAKKGKPSIMKGVTKEQNPNLASKNKGKTLEEIYGFERAAEIKAKITKRRIENNQLYCSFGSIGIHGKYYSVKNNNFIIYESIFERKAFELLENDSTVLKYERSSVTVQYKYDNQVKTHFPDFRITYFDNSQSIVEIKPSDQLLKIVNILKFNSISEYCMKNNLQYFVWTEKELFENMKNYYSYLKHCKQAYATEFFTDKNGYY